MGNFKNIRKVGLAIICFEGTEHLYNIISAIRESVDYVSVGLLRKSYHGAPMSNIDINEIFRLRDEDHLVDNIVEIELDMKKAPREQETDKRNMLILDAEDYGCSHCLVIDSDEYYTKKAFDYGLQKIDDNDYEITYCQYVNYYHDYMHYLKYPFDKGMFVPWVTKTCYRHKFDSTDFNRPSDPTRRFLTGVKSVNGQMVPLEKKAEYHIFEWNEVKMHHLSWIRADIRKKLNCWSSKTVFKNHDDLIDKAVAIFNRFDGDKENESAILLFNTPDNKVDIVKFPKQFIHPRVDFKTRLRPAKDYKKMLFLSMSADIEPFNSLETACNETWRNIDHDRYSNIDAEFWTYTDAPDGQETYLDRARHIIYIKRDWRGKDTGLNSTYSKSIEALKIIDEYLKLDYDYLIRTNNSTWINVPLLNEFLAYLQDDSLWIGGALYAAFYSAFNPYMGGQMMILSKRNVAIIRQLAGTVQDAKRYETQYESCDDNMIGSKINNRNIKLNLFYEDVFHSVGCVDLYERTLPFDEDASYQMDWSCPGYQVKTFDVSNDERTVLDPDKMRRLDALWRSDEHDMNELYGQLMQNWYDRYLSVLPYTKKEWFAFGNAEIRKSRMPYLMPRDEAFAMLPVHLKKCGYIAGCWRTQG